MARKLFVFATLLSLTAAVAAMGLTAAQAETLRLLT